MNVLKKAGIAVYGIGFVYTFKEAFLDSTVRGGHLKKGDMIDYTMYSMYGLTMGVYAAVLWPVPITTKFLVEWK
jgi:hypothetical protein